jgi:hypothetical protein
MVTKITLGLRDDYVFPNNLIEREKCKIYQYMKYAVPLAGLAFRYHLLRRISTPIPNGFFNDFHGIKIIRKYIEEYYSRPGAVHPSYFFYAFGK